MNPNQPADKPTQDNQTRRNRRSVHVPNSKGRVGVKRNTADWVKNIVYDENLPVCQNREEIRKIIQQNQVVILCGETGSGKSTQIPKLLLEMGYADRGIIGHTQPRRIAARSVAARISEELAPSIIHNPGVPHSIVGYKIRFTDSTSENTCIKLMTDGILLAETQHDRLLKQYSVLIIDEAHERSLNIDFLLGYIKRILSRRPDLKLIITSATINAERFAEHFGTYSSVLGFVPAPIITVSGRTFPVEIRYCPPVQQDDEDDSEILDHSKGKRNDDDIDWQRAAVSAVRMLSREGFGDILIFMPTEYDIHETAKLLRSQTIELNNPEILPLYARLSADQQQKIFQPSKHRKIVIATNVAESSITVPGIRYVIDTGTARLSRYSARTKTQRLPIEAISQASADQRAGRCGRIGPGICVRLYSEKDYLSRDKYTTPEIQRTNLAAVILQTIALKLGEIERFPFIDPPKTAAIRDGYSTLVELGALDSNRRITPLGYDLAGLPIDPRIGRMVLAAREEGCLGDVLIIASALELQDPRERPHEKAPQADAAHAQFNNPDSDFLVYLNLWDFYLHLRDTLSRSQLRKACIQNFLSFNRMREWTDIYRQLRDLLGEVKPPVRTNDSDKIHRSLLTGLLANVAYKQSTGEYLTSGGKYVLWPGSSLRGTASKPEESESKDKSTGNINSPKKPPLPLWLMGAEMVETTKRYLRTAAKINPDWIEPMALHLVHRSYTDPHWEKNSGSAIALENVSLFGLPIVSKRKTRYGKIDPILSRQLMIQSGLVEGDIDCKLDFYKRNRLLQAELERLQAKMRRHDFLYGDWKIYEFYDNRIPAQVYDLVSLKQWASEPGNNQLLIMTDSDLAVESAPTGDLSKLFPDTFQGNKLQIPIEYLFHPGEIDDGISVQVPVQAAHQLTQNELNWGVPGLLELRIAGLIKSLPKAQRRPLVPAPDTAAWIVTQLEFGKGNFLEEVARQLNRRGGQGITPAMFDMDSLDDGLKLNVQAIDSEGKIIAQGRELNQLINELGTQTEQQLETHIDPRWNQDNITDWTFGDLPESVAVQNSSATIHAFPMIVDCGSSVSLRLAESLDRAQSESRRGIIRLIQLACRRDLKTQAGHLPGIEKMRLNAALLRYNVQSSNPALVGTTTAFRLDEAISDFIAARSIGESFYTQPLPRTQALFTGLIRRVRENIGYAVQDAASLFPPLWEGYHQAALMRDKLNSVQFDYAKIDVGNQLNALFSPGFLLTTPFNWLKQYPRFLKAIATRLELLSAGSLRKDKLAADTINDFQRQYEEKIAVGKIRGIISNDLILLRWSIEEFRVSCFAQKLGTSIPVSEKRLEKLLEKIG